MLTNTKHLKDLAIHASDGLIGTVDQVWFDDETWGVRYLTVDTGWFGGRTVLISPVSISRVDWPAREIHVALSTKQVEDSPDINTHEPVSRRHEASYMGYYGYPYYWGGPSLWGPAFYPTGLAIPISTTSETTADRAKKESADSHLRVAETVCGYHIEAKDGEIGHVDGFLMDDHTWAIRYIEIATRNWWPGKKVLVSPGWVERVSWLESKVSIALSREVIQSGPEYLDSTPVTREYESLLYQHYGLPPYWLHEEKQKSALDLIGV
jgi:hypothetical protein